MMKKNDTGFKGFHPESVQFLIENRRRNSKPWFESHRDRYETFLMQPFKQLIETLTPVMVSIDPDFELTPAINRTLSRIYRDIRFSKDKSLFRDTMWFIVRRAGEDWKTSVPGFYFEIHPEGYRYGMGFYEASRAVMDRFRDAIDAKPAAFGQIVNPLIAPARFSLHGEKYKRLLPAGHPENIQDWYQRKSFYISCDRDHDSVLFSPALPDDLIEGFILLAPLYRFIIEAVSGAY